VDELALASPSSKIRALFPALAKLVNDPFAAAGRNALGGFPSRAVDISHAAMKPRSNFVFLRFGGRNSRMPLGRECMRGYRIV
jgi:hypothetical protein